MIACLDVYYGDTAACAAGIAFHDWTDSTAAAEQTVLVSEIEPYQPGQFFLRELPCLLSVLERLPRVEVVVVDAYVWLGEKPGLGAHLYQALGGAVAVVGVAKTRFGVADGAREITRGESKSPLFITAAGVGLNESAENIRSMHGAHRIPTLLKKVDQLSRGRPLA